VSVLRGPWTGWAAPSGETAVTIGVFDGVHRGHRHVLQRLGAVAGGRPTVVATFDPHPLAVLAPEHSPRLLATISQRVRLLEAAGVDVVAILEFTAGLSRMPADEFARRVLKGALGAGVIAVGRSFRFGAGRSGDVASLQRLGEDLGFAVEPIELLGGDEPLSSTAARRALGVGDLAAAEHVLGRRYAIAGTVVSGAGRGATIGVPTANLGLDPAQFIPRRGVYAVYLVLDGERLPAVCNIGVRPTFGGTEDVVEVHILDFDRDIRGTAVEVELVARLRDETRFDGVEELVAQIRRDIDEAAAVHAEVEPA
jgi:riboflavin kinase/FMN adenylyltransferase